MNLELIETTRRTKLEQATARIKAALAIAELGIPDGDDHKMWVIDQMILALTGPDYLRWVADYCDGEDGPNTFDWDTGAAP